MSNRFGMMKLNVALFAVLVPVLLVYRPSASVQAQSPVASPAKKKPVVTAHAKGTFEVNTAPEAEDKTEGSTLGRFSLEKHYHGDLEAISKGEMLTAGTSIRGFAG